MKNLNNKKLFLVGLFIVLIILIQIYYCNCDSVYILENNDNNTVISNNYKDIPTATLSGDKFVVNSNTNYK